MCKWTNEILFLVADSTATYFEVFHRRPCDFPRTLVQSPEVLRHFYYKINFLCIGRWSILIWDKNYCLQVHLVFLPNTSIHLCHFHCSLNFEHTFSCTLKMIGQQKKKRNENKKTNLLTLWMNSILKLKY